MKRLITMLLALAMILSLASCGASGGESASDSSAADSSAAETSAETGAGEALGARQAGDDALAIGTIENCGGFDYFTTHGVDNYMLDANAWDTLFRINPNTMELEGNMVESYEWSDDKLALTLTLKEGIHAADGEAITAEDVIWSMDRAIEENSPLNTQYEAYDFDKTWAELSDPSALTFTLYYKYEFGPGLSYLTDPIYPKDWGETTGTEDSVWFDSPNSTGPYTCVENVDGSHTTLQLVEDYWKGSEGMPKTITLYYYTEQTAMYIDYANGKLDMALGLTSDDTTSLINGALADTSCRVQSKLDVMTLCLCDSVEYFDDENVRLAIAHAIDMDAVRDAAMGSLGVVATSTLPSDVNYYVNVGSYEYDVDLAKEYLAKSAYPDGFTLNALIVNSTSTKTAAEMIQYYLSQIGIDLQFEAGDEPVVVPKISNGETDIMFKNTFGATTLDPDQIYDTIGYKSNNLSARVSDDPNDEFNTHLYAALNVIDEAERQENYTWVQQYLYDNAYQIPICELGLGVCFRTDRIAEWNMVMPNIPVVQYLVLAD